MADNFLKIGMCRQEELEAIRSGSWKLRIAPYVGKGVSPNTALLPDSTTYLRIPENELTGQRTAQELKEKMKHFKLKGSNVRFQ